MSKHHVNLTFSTPGGCYCNEVTGSHTRGSNRCRFCVDKAKMYGKKVGSGMYCIIWNEALLEHDGLIKKCNCCLTPFSSHEVIDYDADQNNEADCLPVTEVSKIVKKELKRTGKEIKKWASKGLPVDTAIDVGVDAIISEW